MEKDIAIERIIKLSEELNQHNHNYYVLDNPKISEDRKSVV